MFSEAKVLVISTTDRSQMKDLDISFPEVPHNPVLAKWCGNCDSLKQGCFRSFSATFSNEIFIQKVFLKTVSIDDEIF